MLRLDTCNAPVSKKETIEYITHSAWELVVDFRAAPTDTEPNTIKGQSVEMMNAYRYPPPRPPPSPHPPHIDACHNEAQKRMYLQQFVCWLVA